MNIKKVVRLIVGFSALGVSIPSFLLFTYVTLQDWMLLDAATQEIMINRNKMDSEEMNYLLSRELAHRINVAADGTWALMSAIIGLQAIALVTRNSD
ncbi:hypothetical protein [Crocosphaera sp. Alani8]|uniref:hypothetical protein n=1 Tax=Crocosphaera sp. Alani8 TaxID=3038952 RepID=UPI00313BD57D